MLEKWELVHSPSEKDPNRYRLKLSIDENELSSIIMELKVDSGRPFAAFTDGYNWGLYVYDLSNEKLEKLKKILDEAIAMARPPEVPEEIKTNAPAAKPQARKPAPDPEFVQSAAPEASATESAPPSAQAPAKKPDDTPSKQGNGEFWELNLNSRYNFEEFVVGSNNRFTHAAALAVAENPGKVYNPLFIYGGVGLGKTHLMQAIGHFAKKKFPDLKIFYVTSEKFVSEVIDSIGRGTLQQFRDRYRQVDLLLVDDVQFLSESESTQDEFFHTFNILHQHNKQIVLTSDRPPKRLNTLEDRLRSRFEWGLIADIKSPTLETRVAILKRKGESEQVNLDENMLLYVASKLKSNIRELEGFLKRINAYAAITNQNVDMEMVKSLMKDLLPDDQDKDDAQSAAEPPAAPAPAYQPPVAPAPVYQPPVVPAPAYQPPASSAQVYHPPSQPKITDVDKSFRPIEVVFFYPEGREAELNKAKEKFKEVITKHNLKFRLETVFDRNYSLQTKINYNMFAELCKTNKVSIAIVIGPPNDSGIPNDEFMNSVLSFMESSRISLQYLSWDEINKDYRYLNLALDITLTKHKDASS